jgi:hypothetical protein
MRAIGLLLLLTSLPAPVAGSSLACEPDSSGAQIVRFSGTVAIQIGHVPSGALWKVEELGTDLTLSVVHAADRAASLQAVAVGSRPVRHGIAYGAARTGQLLEVRADAESSSPIGRLQLICAPDATQRMEASCIGAAGEPRSPAAARAWAAQQTPLCGATALQAAASGAYRAGQPVIAEALFAEAGALWTALGDQSRIAASLLGQAEAVWRQGRHVDGLGLARAAQLNAEQAGARYLAARAHGQSCLAQRGVGELAHGATCQLEVVDRYLQLGEASAAASALLSAAAMAREDGRRSDLAAVTTRLATLERGNLTALVRGRSLHLRAGLALDEGDLQTALSLLADAMDAFESVPSALWLAASNLQAARVHSALGAQTEAQYLARAAADGFRAIGMPEREGAAWLLLARVQAELNAPELAVEAADLAASRYREAARPQLRLASALAALSADPTAARLAQVEALVDASDEQPPRLSFDLALARARLAIDQGRGEWALARLAAMDARIPDVPRWIALLEVQAEAERSLGRAAHARARLELAMATLRHQADAIDSPVLAHMAARRLRRLAAAWIDTLAASDAGDPELVSKVGQVLLGTHPTTWLRGQAQATSASEAALLRRVLSQAMAADGQGGTDALDVAEVQRLLWQSPVGPPAVGPDAAEAWGNLRTRAAAGARVLLIGLGRKQGVSVMVDGPQASMSLIPQVPDVLAQVARLRAGAGDRMHPVHALDAAAERLSRRLLPSGVAQPPPQSLALVLDDALAGLPFALLRWPGSQLPLVATTQLSYVLPAAGADQQVGSPSRPVALAVLIAGTGARAQADRPMLPALPVAMREAGLVAAARPDWQVTTLPLTLEPLRTALESPGARVHVAGHGAVVSGIQGFSGLWSAPETDGRTSFISWIELAGRPLRASLVVLNACALGGDGGGAGEAAANFAQVVHASGVRDVVAALWPVSDSAGALWVPAFYRALDKNPADVADAVRQAQLRLRESRAFRHPYYWASLAHWGPH